jgi:hypothetical protein
MSGLFKLKFMKFGSKWDLLSIVFHQIPNRGKMRFPPAMFIQFVLSLMIQKTPRNFATLLASSVLTAQQKQ